MGKEKKKGGKGKFFLGALLGGVAGVFAGKALAKKSSQKAATTKSAAKPAAKKTTAKPAAKKTASKKTTKKA